MRRRSGRRYLERSGRTLRLTRTGEVFKPHVDRLLAELRGGLDAVAQFVSPETGTVTVAFQQSLGSWLVPDLLGSFRAAHPGVGFRLTTRATSCTACRSTAARPTWRSAPAASGPAAEATRPGDLAVRTQRIGNEPLRLALPASHPLAAGPGSGIRLAEAAGEPFIALRPTSALRKLGDDLCAAAGFRPKIVFEGDDLSNVRGLVTAGLGVAIVPLPARGLPGGRPRPGALPADPRRRRRPRHLPDLASRQAPAPRRRPVPQARNRHGKRGPHPPGKRLTRLLSSR